MDFFEPIIKADFRAIEEYKYQPMDNPFSIPIFVRVGDEERITSERLNAWQRETLFPINVRRLSGDHFFIFNDPKLIIEQIIEAHIFTIK